MSTRIRVEMKPVNTILTRLGVNKTGDVQMFLTNTVNRRITRYMPYRSSALSTKLKLITGPAEITVLGPYARYQYYGKAMEGRAPKHVTERPLNYDKTKNPLAGPFWDRALMSHEKDAIIADIQEYVDRKAGKR